MRGEERILFWPEHPAGGVVVVVTEIGMLGIGKAFGVHRSSQLGGCKSAGLQEVGVGRSAQGKVGLPVASRLIHWAKKTLASR